MLRSKRWCLKLENDSHRYISHSNSFGRFSSVASRPYVCSMITVTIGFARSHSNLDQISFRSRSDLVASVFRLPCRAPQPDVRMLSGAIHRHHFHAKTTTSHPLLRIQPDHPVCPHFVPRSPYLPPTPGRWREDFPR